MAKKAVLIASGGETLPELLGGGLPPAAPVTSLRLMARHNRIRNPSSKMVPQ